MAPGRRADLVTLEQIVEPFPTQSEHGGGARLVSSREGDCLKDQLPAHFLPRRARAESVMNLSRLEMRLSSAGGQNFGTNGPI